ncbi:MAG: serine/threonine protein kinase, partial [Candidatus Dadabacteria bacterium]
MDNVTKEARVKLFDKRYQILSILGRGSQSVVYKAIDVGKKNKEVALKVLVRKKDKKLTEQLRKEALILVSCKHKNIIQLYDFHALNELCYLSLEYAPYGDLNQYLHKVKKLTAEQAVLFLIQTAEALQAMHDAGIYHRDVKPDNILVANPSLIKLGDLGVASLPGEEFLLEELRKGVGTLSYMPPEVLVGKGFTQRSDLYALGVTFWEVLAGTHPFEGVPLLKQLSVREDKNLVPLSKKNPEVPQYLSDAILKLMRFKPQDRFSSAEELIKFLKKKGASKQSKTVSKEEVNKEEKKKS